MRRRAPGGRFSADGLLWRRLGCVVSGTGLYAGVPAGQSLFGRGSGWRFVQRPYRNRGRGECLRTVCSGGGGPWHVPSGFVFGLPPDELAALGSSAALWIIAGFGVSVKAGSLCGVGWRYLQVCARGGPGGAASQMGSVVACVCSGRDEEPPGGGCYGPGQSARTVRIASASAWSAVRS